MRSYIMWQMWQQRYIKKKDSSEKKKVQRKERSSINNEHVIVRSL